MFESWYLVFYWWSEALWELASAETEDSAFQQKQTRVERTIIFHLADKYFQMS